MPNSLGIDRRETGLSVSVQKLRAAFARLSRHCWEFLETTRDHMQSVPGAHESTWATLLQLYAASVASTQGGTPAELVQSASEVE